MKDNKMKDKETNSEIFEFFSELFKPHGINLEKLTIENVPKSDKEESECNDS